MVEWIALDEPLPLFPTTDGPGATDEDWCGRSLVRLVCGDDYENRAVLVGVVAKLDNGHRILVGDVNYNGGRSDEALDGFWKLLQSRWVVAYCRVVVP